MPFPKGGVVADVSEQLRKFRRDRDEDFWTMAAELERAKAEIEKCRSEIRRLKGEKSQPVRISVIPPASSILPPGTTFPRNPSLRVDRKVFRRGDRNLPRGAAANKMKVVPINLPPPLERPRFFTGSIAQALGL